MVRSLVVLALALAACGAEEAVGGDEAGATSSEGGDASLDDTMDESGPTPVAGFCGLPCDDEADCVAAGGGAIGDWTCNFVGLAGVCEPAGEMPPACEPEVCPAGAIGLCAPSLGPTICVASCRSDADCAPSLSCSGTLEDGSSYCATREGVGCSSAGCTCFDDADCPTSAASCGPVEG